jgi:predicted flap endonuclease-1-like 5' DNA nuclease
MAELLQDNWIALVVALLIGLFVAWWLLVASRRTRVTLTPPEDGAPARRNQALIDAPPAAQTPVPPPTPAGLAGAGEAIQALAEPAPAAVAPTDDELLRIKGLGPKLAEQLRALGIVSLAQIAAWDDADIDNIDARLGRFQGRIRRDDWPAQAKLLTAGDQAAYEARFGRI